MKPTRQTNPTTTPEHMLDMRRPDIVKGTIVPVSRRAIDNMIVAPTSS